MSTTVRIAQGDKARLRRLQALWRRLRGHEPNQQELLHRVIEYAERRQDDFLAESAWRPLTDEEFQFWRRKARPLGDWSARDVDDIVYGD